MCTQRCLDLKAEDASGKIRAVEHKTSAAVAEAAVIETANAEAAIV